jgi:RNA polymerase-binding transcription factor DksA
MHNTQVRQRLELRRTELRTRSQHIGSDLQHAATPVEGSFADQSVARANDAVLGAIQLSADVELQYIDNALRRLEDGSYGRCEVCHGAIAPQRLAAVPYATTCAICATP